MNITAIQLEKLGLIADKADNFYHGSTIPMRDSIHKECLASGMNDISQELKELYTEISGNDPWSTKG